MRTSGVTEGLVHADAMHSTATVWVNDNERGLHADIDEWLERLAPIGPAYRHHATGEDNVGAHFKALLLGRSITVPVTDGELDLGPWESIFYHEFDGQRRLWPEGVELAIITDDIQRPVGVNGRRGFHIEPGGI